jgi:Flp pilus assembly protein TadD
MTSFDSRQDGTAADSNNIQVLRMRAEAAFQKTDFHLAIQDAEAVLAQAPDDAWMSQVLIQSALLTADMVRVQAADQHALKYHPENPFFQFVAAKLAIANGDLSEAHEYLHRLLAKNPDEPQVHSLAAELLLQQGEFDNACHELEEAIHLGGTTPKNMNCLAWVYFNAGRYDDALALFFKSVAAHAMQSDAYIGAGYCYLKQRNISQASRQCDLASSHFPQDIRIWELRFCIACEQHDDTAIKLALRRINELDPLGKTDSAKKAKEYLLTHV